MSCLSFNSKLPKVQQINSLKPLEYSQNGHISFRINEALVTTEVTLSIQHDRALKKSQGLIISTEVVEDDTEEKTSRDMSEEECFEEKLGPLATKGSACF